MKSWFAAKWLLIAGVVAALLVALKGRAVGRRKARLDDARERIGQVEEDIDDQEVIVDAAREAEITALREEREAQDRVEQEKQEGPTDSPSESKRRMDDELNR